MKNGKARLLVRVGGAHRHALVIFFHFNFSEDKTADGASILDPPLKPHGARMLSLFLKSFTNVSMSILFVSVKNNNPMLPVLDFLRLSPDLTFNVQHGGCLARSRKCLPSESTCFHSLFLIVFLRLLFCVCVNREHGPGKVKLNYKICEQRSLGDYPSTVARNLKSHSDGKTKYDLYNAIM